MSLGARSQLIEFMRATRSGLRTTPADETFALERGEMGTDSVVREVQMAGEFRDRAEAALQKLDDIGATAAETGFLSLHDIR
jgi:hypothetical protein